MNGFLNIFKAPGWTSHDVVNKIRKHYNIKKVGHLGTLDPGARGVLPIALGKATKLSQYILSQDKIYRFELTLGVTTDTLDAQGDVVTEAEVGQDDIRQLLNNYNLFIGKINQTPPMYSAIKQNGEKLYELARRGETVERPSRDINVYSLACLDHYFSQGKHKLLFEVSCSKGTYIRTLAKDLAELTDCGQGHMSFLVRTQTGDFSLKSARSIEELPYSVEELASLIYPLDYPLIALPAIKLTDSHLAKKIINGNFISLGNNGTVGEICRLYDCTDGKEQFIGMGKFLSSDSIKPEKIIL